MSSTATVPKRRGSSRRLGCDRNATACLVLAKLLLLAAASCLAVLPAAADTVYTWEDETGAVHITDRKPPDDAKILDVNRGQSPPPPSENVPPPGPPAAEPPDTSAHNLAVSDLQKEIERARTKAKASRLEADRARKEAEQVRKAAEEYVNKVAGKARKRKSLRIKAGRRAEESFRATERAMDLEAIAEQDEARVRGLEEALQQLTVAEPQSE